VDLLCAERMMIPLSAEIVPVLGLCLRDKLRMVSVHGGAPGASRDKRIEHEKGIRWMPWHQEAMKDVARCEKPRGAASRL
jgi:hypothetical protein